MPVTVPTPATRYFQPELTKVYMVPSIASASLLPTLAELGASTDVSADVADLGGFSQSTADIAVPDLGTRFVSSIPGRITADASSITFYADPTGADVRAIFAQNQNTNIAIFANGAVTGSAMDVYKVTVSSVSHIRGLEDAPRLMVSFTIRKLKENATYPTT